MQGASLNVNGVAVVSKSEPGQKEGWYFVELGEVPSSTENGKNWEKSPLRAKIKVAAGQSPPQEGMVLEIRGGSLERSPGEIEGKPVAFWNLTVFSWRSLSLSSGRQEPTQSSEPKKVVQATVPKKPVLDNTATIPDDDEVPF